MIYSQIGSNFGFMRRQCFQSIVLKFTIVTTFVSEKGFVRKISLFRSLNGLFSAFVWSSYERFFKFLFLYWVFLFIFVKPLVGIVLKFNLSRLWYNEFKFNVLEVSMGLLRTMCWLI